MIDREQLLDELGRVFARAAVDALLAREAGPETTKPERARLLSGSNTHDTGNTLEREQTTPRAEASHIL